VTRGPEASTRLTAISGIHPSAPTRGVASNTL